MKRLREFEGSTDPLMRRAAELVRSAEPVAPSELRVRWARRRLNSAAHSRRLGVLRPASAFLLVFGLAATAGAAWGTGRLIMDEYFGVNESSLAEPALQESIGRIVRQRSPARSPSSPALAVEPDATARDLGDDALWTDPNTSGGEATRARATTRPPKPSGSGASSLPAASVGASPSAAGTGSDAALVLGGLRALRQDGDPKEAARLLDEYRERVPNGALAEEALALSIEAALAQGDQRARQLADTYLQRYPKGRFREAAKRAKATRPTGD